MSMNLINEIKSSLNFFTLTRAIFRTRSSIIATSTSTIGTSI